MPTPANSALQSLQGF